MRKQPHCTHLLVIITMLTINISDATTQIRVEKDVVYGVMSGLSLTMDVYYPTHSNKRSVVFVPRSGRDGRDREYTEYQLKSGYGYVNDLRDAIVQAGFTVFVPNHRMAPVHQDPAAVDDIRRAIRYIRGNSSEFGILPFPLGAAGHSSGGHLTAMAGVLDDDADLQNSPYLEERESLRVRAVVTIAAPHDLTVNSPTLWTFVVSFMGERPPMDDSFSAYLREGTYAEASTVTHVTPDDAAFLLVHGTGDPVVPSENLHIMNDAVTSAGLSVATMSIEADSHAPPLDNAAIVSWLETQLLCVTEPLLTSASGRKRPLRKL